MDKHKIAKIGGSFRSVAIRLAFLIVAALGAGGKARELNGHNEGEHIDEHRLIDIVGFNYTDRLIDTFTVNGQGGGNFFLSSRIGGGGKSACCVSVPRQHSRTTRIRVRWQVDGCIYLTKSRISGEVFKNIFPYFKEADVEVVYREKRNPQHLEIHFYPNGTVLAEVTGELSPPRIRLDGERTDKSHFPRCRDDKKPE